ncbi:Glycosyl hydrolases family 16 [Streptomyces sp. YIM 121038]|uniref:glycoside hydrolase family 16 protein n=1 Tax=Streptomyces sp. YIM 121038 TaxID=2136401 RepID=UPI001110A123|nr:glycoside hydrolase family 16 protein [Streptomyces sp. YIM 121038]QCX81241.1 Glycosyl hydrolases family 16 [Streptomyces sp. YIM 121038]
MRRALTIAGTLAALLLWHVTAPTADAGRVADAGPSWQLRFSDGFNTPVARGRFTDCAHYVDTPKAYCGGLSGSVRTNWWAYPHGWPDTATQRDYPVGGIYDPASTVWISDGQMHIRMWRGSNGPVHSAAVVPKRLMNQRYGRYEERFRVSKVAPGYKSAHLLWPVVNDSCSEIDHPELEWTETIAAFHHPSNCTRQAAFDTGKRWSDWHTSRIEWKPGEVRFYLDGQLVGRSANSVPDKPMSWIIQNEAALNGDQAAPNSSAQMDIAWVKGWSWS